MTVNQIYKYYYELVFARVPKELRSDFIIAGGAIRDLIANQLIKDIDIFPINVKAEKALIEWVTNYVEGSKPYVLETSVTCNYFGHTLQIVRGRYPHSNWLSLLRDFDFNVCMVGMTHAEIFADPRFWQGMATKQLRLENCKYPLSSLRRLRYFLEKGYNAGDDVLVTIARAINAINRGVFSNDPNALELDRPMPESLEVFYGPEDESLQVKV